MSLVARWLCLWMLALALPLQGAAASTLFACPATSAPASAEPQGVRGDVDAGAPSPRAIDDANGAAHLAHDHDATCSLCADCCSQAALPSEYDAADEPLAIGAPPPTSGSRPVSHTPDGIDRPPRRRNS